MDVCSDQTVINNSFMFCPKCGSPGLKKLNLKQFHCRNCDFTFFLNTAAATVALIVNDKAQLLVTRRKFDPAKDRADLPGGFADPGETVEACLVREIREELNLDIRSYEYFCSCPNTYLYKDVLYHTIDMAFICDVADFAAITPMDDVCGHEFINIENLVPETFGLESIQKIIRRFVAFSTPGLQPKP